MAETEKLTPVEYLDRFFDELRNEVRSNPELANRLVRSLGATVTFDLAEAPDAANPFIAASEMERPKFVALYSKMKIGQLKKLLRTNNLATVVDMRGKSASQLVDLLYSRAHAKVGERKI